MSSFIIIPIKTNNQRLPGKNTRLLGNLPLFQHTFDTARKCNVNEVCVCSSDLSIIQSSIDNGFATISRPESLNSSQTSGHDLISFEINELKLDDSDIFIQLFVTQPFLKSETIDSAVSLLIDNPEKDCVLPLFKVENRFWYDGNPVAHNPETLMGTQYEKPVFCEAGFYVFRVGAFRSEGTRVTKNRLDMIVDSSECIDIDTELDFKYAETILKDH